MNPPPPVVAGTVLPLSPPQIEAKLRDVLFRLTQARVEAKRILKELG